MTAKAMRIKAKGLLSLAVVLGGAGLLMTLLRPASASHLSQGTWAHAVNACAIDEANVGQYQVGVSFLSHEATATGPLIARCNVENLPIDPGDVLGLELVYRDQDGPGTAYSVSARLLATTNSGSVVQIAVVNSNTGPVSTSFQRSQIATFSHDLNFANNAYYVEIIVSRNNTAQAPAAAIVRIVGLIL